MARYSSLAAYKKDLGGVGITSRSKFLETVRYATIENLDDRYKDEATTRALVFCQHYEVVAKSHCCAEC